jgi:hypothetical protein
MSCPRQSGASDRQILLVFDPFSQCQPLEHGTVKTTVRAVIDILGSGGLAQTGEA